MGCDTAPSTACLIRSVESCAAANKVFYWVGWWHSSESSLYRLRCSAAAHGQGLGAARCITLRMGYHSPVDMESWGGRSLLMNLYSAQPSAPGQGESQVNLGHCIEDQMRQNWR